MTKTEIRRMVTAAAAACEDKKAEQIRILELDPADSGFTDYFLICSGTNDRQNQAIATAVEERMERDFNTRPNSIEGYRQGEWILLDYVDFVVHIFSEEKRDFYHIERLRKTATTLDLEELKASLTKRVSAVRKKVKPPKRSPRKNRPQKRSPPRKSPPKKAARRLLRSLPRERPSRPPLKSFRNQTPAKPRQNAKNLFDSDDAVPDTQVETWSHFKYRMKLRGNHMRKFGVLALIAPTVIAASFVAVPAFAFQGGNSAYPTASSALSAEITSKLDTKNATVGEVVIAKTLSSTTLGNGTDIPRGAMLSGKVTAVRRSRLAEAPPQSRSPSIR